ncbi:hypothetical protein II906_07715, partial [bacterium]|nr:hypothetical protein [bacterium]
MIPIFMATDNNYAPYLIVVIKSVCENTKSNLIFYILVKDIDQIFKDKIIEMVSQYKNCNVEFININKHNIFSECHNRNYISK